MRSRHLAPAALLTALLGGSFLTHAQSSAAPASLPGTVSDTEVLLPNGWRLSPAGTQVTVGQSPLAMTQSPDGRYLITSNNGLNKPTLTVIDLATAKVRSTMTVDNAWLGLAWHPNGTRLYSGGASQNVVQELAYVDGTLRPSRLLPLPGTTDLNFVGGLTVSADGRRLYALQVFNPTLVALDLTSGQVVASTPLAAEPYAAVLSPDGRTLLVSLWGASKVQAFNAATLELLFEVPVDEHPNAMAVSADGRRLFVACASSDTVWVIDLQTWQAMEQVSLSLYPDAPIGATPNGLGLSPDGRTLLVANGTGNSVAVLNVGNPARTLLEGFIPTGWFPTGVAFSRDAKQIFVLNGRGLRSAPTSTMGGSLIAPGTVSILATPNQAALGELTRRVYALTPYRGGTALAPANAPVASPIPQTVGGVSPINYVFYVIRENRTYDQVLGDMKEGNGDSRLVLFGEEVTPNAHALARDFVLLDNFYVNAEVSYNGHAYSTAAYATDFIEKLWPTLYAGRGGRYLGEGGYAMRNPFGNITAPAQGYLWDFAKRAGVTVRSYGEFVASNDAALPGQPRYVPTVPGLNGFINADFPGWDLTIPDNARVDVWWREMNAFEEQGTLPRLSIIRLGNDHTFGTRPGMPTPRAMVAENDLALGRLVERISASRYWSQSAIFVLEDDSQNGPDHVDSHRSIALVISPFARRGAVDHTLYTTCGFLRTMELILGLPPMSQCDAAATPAYGAFQTTPDLKRYGHRAARIRLDELNPPNAVGAQASLEMNFDEADLTPEFELNDIVWRATRGANHPMPPPKRAALVRGQAGDGAKGRGADAGGH